MYEGPKGSEIYWTDDLDLGTAWGPSVGASYLLNPCNPCNRIGFEFYAIDGWSSTSQVSGNNSVQFPSLVYLPELTTPGVPESGFGTATFRYDSNLYNTEVNLYHQSSRFCWLTALAGFRWIEIGEDFTTVFQTGNTTPNYSIDVNNHLYGFQLGTVAKLQSMGAWRLDAWGKLGVYGNAADQTTTEDFRSADGLLLSGTASDPNVAFAGDMGISLSRQLTSCLSVRVSYMALWVDGIALAPEQLPNTDLSNNIVTLDLGSAFYHGGFLGGEFCW